MSVNAANCRLSFEQQNHVDGQFFFAETDLVSLVLFGEKCLGDDLACDQLGCGHVTQLVAVRETAFAQELP